MNIMRHFKVSKKFKKATKKKLDDVNNFILWSSYDNLWPREEIETNTKTIERTEKSDFNKNIMSVLLLSVLCYIIWLAYKLLWSNERVLTERKKSVQRSTINVSTNEFTLNGT